MQTLNPKPKGTSRGKFGGHQARFGVFQGCFSVQVGLGFRAWGITELAM